MEIPIISDLLRWLQKILFGEPTTKMVVDPYSKTLRPATSTNKRYESEVTQADIAHLASIGTPASVLEQHWVSRHGE